MTGITHYTTCEIRKYNRCALLNIRPAKVTHTPRQPYTCAQCYTAPLILLLLLLILPEMNMVTYVGEGGCPAKVYIHILESAKHSRLYKHPQKFDLL